MALLTSAPISSLAVELLRRNLVLVATATPVPGDEYGGPSGGTVTLAVPQPRTAREQTTPGDAITFDPIVEQPVDVTVRHLYDAVHVTDEDLSLTLVDFGRQILLPQVVSVATGAEDQLADAMNGLAPDIDIDWDADPDDAAATKATLLAAREKMSDDGVPAGSRYFAVAPDIATRLLKVEEFTRADARGQTTALEEAIIGRLYGYTFVESAALDPGTGVAYHSSAFAWGNRPPVAPGGGADSTNASEGGVSLRHVLAFDAAHLSTASVVSVFAGAAVVPEDGDEDVRRAIRIGGPVS